MDSSKLPFVVQPKRKAKLHRFGSDDAGYMEIPVKGYLTTGERSFIQQAMTAEESTVAIVSLSRKIATEYNMDLDQAYNEVLVVMGGAKSEGTEILNSREIALKYNAELTQILTNLSINADKEKMVAAIALLRYRVNPDIEFEDVMKLHPDLINGLYDIYKAESEGDLKMLEDKVELKKESVEEIEKKPSRRRKPTEVTK